MSKTEKKNYLDELIRHLTDYEQIDDEGIMVVVSRQACDEAAEALRRLKGACEKAGDATLIAVASLLPTSNTQHRKQQAEILEVLQTDE